MLPAAPAKKAAAASDWTKTVTVTPDGGYRMGNPAAPVKLVEYGSLTCGACGRFAQEGVPQLVSKYVRTGRVSFEFRNYVRDPADIPNFPGTPTFTINGKLAENAATWKALEPQLRAAF